MAGELSIVRNKEKVSMDLLLTADPSIPNAARALNTCLPFAGMLEDKTVAVCMLEKKDQYYDLTYIAVASMYQDRGFAKEILLYAMDYVRSQGGRYIEAGCGNSNMPLIALYQKAGFRIIGVWTDYYLYDGRTLSIENSICNRDMVRFRVDLNEKTMSTTGSDISGRR